MNESARCALRGQPGVLQRSRLSIALTFALAAAGCSGALMVPEGGTILCQSSAQCPLDKTCNVTTGMCEVSKGACSAAVPDGDCFPGYLCRVGVCICVDPELCPCLGDDCTSVPDSWCDCEPEQGCTPEGICVAVIKEGPDANNCAPERPNGVCERSAACCESGTVCCPGDEICVADHCVPNNRPCSEAEPNGWCEPGLSCLPPGRCVPTVACTCAPDSTSVCCPAGSQCTDGRCEEQPCTATFPGRCDRDAVCGDTECERLPCSPNHLGGECDQGQFCSKVGECIEEHTCRVDEDCSGEATYCSHARICVAPGACAVDDDCEITLAASFGQGYTCEVFGSSTQGACVERLECAIADDECVPEKYCSVAGNCLAQPYCDDNSDCVSVDTPQRCSNAEPRECICADNCCLVDEDCDVAAGEMCGQNERCLRGECATDGDCHPQYECQTELATCVARDTAIDCNSNEVTLTGCDAGELSCCPEGQICCPGEHQRCTEDEERVCITAGTCVVDEDCLTADFLCEDHLCVPTKSCANCEDDEKCTGIMVGPTFMTGCIPQDSCLEDDDCPDGETCGADGACYPDESHCGATTMSTGSAVEPNVLIVLDRSGSMNICGQGDTSAGACGYNAGTCTYGAADQCLPEDENVCQQWWNLCFDADCDTGDPTDPDTPNSTVTRWEDAYEAVGHITAAYAGDVRFGLVIYPLPSYLDEDSTDDDGCWKIKDDSTSDPIKCNWDRCSNSYNSKAGGIAMPVSPSTTSAAILAALDQTAPGGGTPTGATLRTILAQEDRAGLAATDRPNAILLVTDGEATGDSDDPGIATPAAVLSCEPPCGDGETNGSETDEDCGGMCAPCGTGLACATDDDCQTRVCRVGRCRGETCSDDGWDRDAGETDVDCGGPCAPCDAGKLCNEVSDCASEVCTDGRCQIPTCDDDTTNGTETDEDCGGDCTALCETGKGCAVDDDCQSGVCQAGTCRVAECGNDTLDASIGETDKDCGGTSCAPCDETQTCQSHTDCATEYCGGTPLTCGREHPDCHNGALDAGNGETDVDCGGTNCPACPGGRVCTANTDCISNACRPCDWDSSDPAQPADPYYYLQQACWADSAIDRLFAETPRIRTFVVGFAFGGVNPYLNCHAARGRSLRPDVPACAAATVEGCADLTDACYYQADNREELSNAFDTIIDRVSSCDYPVTRPPEPNRIFVYLEDRSVDPPVRERLQRGVSWEYILATDQLQLYGSACAKVKDPNLDYKPLIIYGCIEGGG